MDRARAAAPLCQAAPAPGSEKTESRASSFGWVAVMVCLQEAVVLMPEARGRARRSDQQHDIGRPGRDVPGGPMKVEAPRSLATGSSAPRTAAEALVSGS